MKKSLVIFLIFCSSLLICRSQTINTIAGNGVAGYTGNNGLATAAELSAPAGLCIDKKGSLLIADSYNNVIRNISTSGIITTIAGNGNGGYSGDNGPATAAELYGPCCIAIDKKGDIYISDLFNCVVRKIDTAGIITTIAGNGSGGYSGDGGPATAAELYFPMGLSLDTLGNIYVADSYNGRIRKISTSGTITTFAGNGFGCNTGDGGLATAAGICTPDFISLDDSGRMYISSDGSNEIRKVNTLGVITTVVGNGTAGYTGDGGPATAAELDDIDGVVLDTLGNLYIADEVNNVIRRVDKAGIITTVGGDGYGAGVSGGYSGDGGAATAAELYYPCCPIIDFLGNFYFSDGGNNRVRKISGLLASLNQCSKNSSPIRVFPNPNNGLFNLTIGNYAPGIKNTVEIYNILGVKVRSEELNTNSIRIDLGDSSPGIYLLRVINQKGEATANSKVIVN